MRRLVIAPTLGIGALLSLAALCPVAGDDAAGPAGAWLGVSTQAQTGDWPGSKHFAAKGVKVIEVTPGGPADQARIVPGDILVSIGTRALKEPADLVEAERALVPDRPVQVVMARGGGRTIMTFSMRPGRVPGTSDVAASGGAGAGAAPSETAAAADSGAVADSSATAAVRVGATAGAVVGTAATPAEGAANAGTGVGTDADAAAGAAGGTGPAAIGADAASGAAAGTGAAADAGGAIGSGAGAVAGAVLGAGAAAGAIVSGGSDSRAAADTAAASIIPASPDSSSGVIAPTDAALSDTAATLLAAMSDSVPVPTGVAQGAELPPDTVSAASFDQSKGAAGLGVRCENLGVDLAKVLGVQAGKGVLVLAVTTSSPADRAGVRPGDVITFAAGQPVPDVDHLDAIVTAATPPIVMTTVRKGTTRIVTAQFVAQPPDAHAATPQDSTVSALRDEVRKLQEELRTLREEKAKANVPDGPRP